MLNKNKVMRRTMAAFIMCLGFTQTAAPVFAMNQTNKNTYQQVACFSSYYGQIFEYSSSVYLSESDLYGLTKDEIQACINDIYARHGYIFKDPDIRAYYERQCWYYGCYNDMATAASYFNSVEQANIQLLTRYKEIAPTTVSYSSTSYSCFPDTSTTVISTSDLYGLSRDQIQMMINDIYARHGYIFKDADIRAYYESQYWYCGRYSDMGTVANSFNSVERQNIATMKAYIG